MISSLLFLSLTVTLLFSIMGIINVYAANLESHININNDEFPFKINYHKTIFIEHMYGGKLSEDLQGHKWDIEDYADSSNSGVQDLMNKLNIKIASDGSQARITDLNVSYGFHLIARDLNTTILLEVTLEGTLTDYIISKDSQGTMIDLGWRGLSTNNEIVINGVEINIPINILRDQEPEVYSFFIGTEVEKVFTQPIINADSILEQQLPIWHYLFDPTGVNIDRRAFGLPDDNLIYEISVLSMDDGPIRDSAFVDTVTDYEIMSDQHYTVKDIKSYNKANIAMIGTPVLNNLNGVEIAKILVNHPVGYTPPDTHGEQKYYWLALIIVVFVIGIFFWLTKYWVNRSHLKTKP